MSSNIIDSKQHEIYVDYIARPPRQRANSLAFPLPAPLPLCYVWLFECDTHGLCNDRGLEYGAYVTLRTINA